MFIIVLLALSPCCDSRLALCDGLSSATVDWSPVEGMASEINTLGLLIVKITLGKSFKASVIKFVCCVILNPNAVYKIH